MSETYSGTATYPTLPLTLAVDGETINHANLIKDAAAGTGWIGKLLDHTVTNRARLDRLLSIDTAGTDAQTGVVSANGLAPTFTSATPTNSSILTISVASAVVGDLILVYWTSAWKAIGASPIPTACIYDGANIMKGSLVQTVDLGTPNVGTMASWGLYTVASAGTKTFTVRGADTTGAEGWAFYEPWQMRAITIRA